MQYIIRRGARPRHKRTAGFTLIELIVATTILVIVTGMIIPLARLSIKREKERELRYDLRMMRDSNDCNKDAADWVAFQIIVVTKVYQRDLDTQVNGDDGTGKKVRYV